MQVNSLWVKLSVASKWASKRLWGTIYFAVDGTCICMIIRTYRHNMNVATINTKIKGTPKGVHFPFRSYSYSILAEVNLLAHNNLRYGYVFVQVNSLQLK